MSSPSCTVGCAVHKVVTGKNGCMHTEAPKPAMRESQIEDYLVRRVHAMGGEVRKVQWIGRRGAPDRLVMLPPGIVVYPGPEFGWTIWIELKAPGKKPPAYQLREHDRMRAMGQRVVVVDSLDGVDVLLLLP